MTEAEFQGGVVEFAQLHGWLVAHFRPARTEKGWRTPVSADGQGFPDLVMVRGIRLIFAELKSDRGLVGDKQQMWLDALGEAAVVGAALPIEPLRRQFEVYVWRPRDWPEIELRLKR